MIDKYSIKNRLEEVLIYYGFQQPKNNFSNWTCLHSRHNNPQNDLTVTGNLFCCHCGLQGDIFNLISEMEGLNIKTDFQKILNKAIYILNLNVPVDDKNRYIQGKTFNAKSNNHSNIEKISNRIDLTSIIIENFEKRNKKRDIYFRNRGLNNYTIGKYKLFAMNPTQLFDENILPKLNNIYSYEYIIPVWENGKVVNCILRRNDWKNTENKKTLNLKNLDLKMINLDYLNQKNDYLFICEGWADCLSFENEGYKSISINAITMINRFMHSIKENKKNLLETKFYICFDQDNKEDHQKNWGQKYSIKLNKMLKEENLNSRILKINYKDVNEFYIKNKNLFRKSLKGLI